jgi:8-oxo-dGTP pyrophosphatase MutT (NUDIX family)
MNYYCNNCGKTGHSYQQCRVPITSIGIIAFRRDPTTQELEYLMICRKDTLGYIDFMRGKYSVYNKDYIMNMLKQMTKEEKQKLRDLEFEELWSGIWGTHALSNQYKSEELVSRDKIYNLRSGIIVHNDFYTLKSLLDDSEMFTAWDEPEWGFPKGRRNFQEKDYECAIREFCEETGYLDTDSKIITNILPFEEIFMGSNYKSYKHKYFVAFMDYKTSQQETTFEPSEVSKMRWCPYDECIRLIRDYNTEKVRLLTNIHHCLQHFELFSV